MNDVRSRLLKTPAGEHWQQLEVKNHHGCALPLFSLRTEKSGGIGEFLDLLPLISWCKQVGFDVIQLLPLNDTGLDPSPYNAISGIALNPLHISLYALPQINMLPHFEEKFRALQNWNHTARVKYDIVRDLKMSLLKEYFHLFFSGIREKPEYQNFIRENPWLFHYSLFKALKEVNEWRSWEDWPSNMKSPTEAQLKDLANEFQEAIHFHNFLQFLAFQQMETVRKEADKEKVWIKGDIPILISRDSADVWGHRNFFLLHLAVGAPPDVYSALGQYWGFPAYDWEAQEKTAYSWWQERLKVCAKLYHLYRIDHVVGFFRLWVIPVGHPANQGSFMPAEENQWIPHGRHLMEMMLKSTKILPIGEDLGLVPPSVKHCLKELGICGTKVMRWERRWDQDGGFIPIQDYPPESMTTVSTHDSDTLQLWWRHSPKEAKLYCDYKGWDYRPFLSPDRQTEMLHDSHQSGSLFHINLLQEYLAVFPELVSPNLNDERINIPGKLLETNWTYRFRQSVEEWKKNEDLIQMIQSLTALGTYSRSR